MVSPKLIEVEVAYANNSKQSIQMVQVPANSTVEYAIRAANILNYYPEIELSSAALGIFGRPCSLGTILQQDDRIEIYRKLYIDPKEARLKRCGRRR